MRIIGDYVGKIYSKDKIREDNGFLIVKLKIS